MQKIYGFNQADIIDFAKFYSDKRNLPLKNLFLEYSVYSGKAQGTVRNLYYALAKASENDAKFLQEYLGGVSINVCKIREFNSSDEQDLIKDVLEGVKQGKSVRSTVLILANGDAKLALRYQNKYRNLCKNKPELVQRINAEIEGSTDFKCVYSNSDKFSIVPESLMNKLKKEIDGLVERISLKTKRENEYLKKRVSFLELENIRLSNMLFGLGKEPKVKKYFDKKTQELMS